MDTYEDLIISSDVTCFPSSNPCTVSRSEARVWQSLRHGVPDTCSFGRPSVHVGLVLRHDLYSIVEQYTWVHETIRSLSQVFQGA